MAASSETAHTNAGSFEGASAADCSFQELEPKRLHAAVLLETKSFCFLVAAAPPYDAKLAGFSGAALPGPGPLTRALDPTGRG